MSRRATLALLLALAEGTVVQVNYGYFREPAGHLWTYGVDAHTWTDPATGTTFNYTYWPQSSGGKVIKKLQSGELDIAHLGSAPWSTGALRGTPARMIYVIHSKDQSQCLVARKGISLPSDLRGKRLAYIRGSTTHFMLNGLLLGSALTEKDFDFIGHMSVSQQKEAWDRGEIDAGFMWGGGMRYLQDNAWCTRPDPSSPNYRPCVPSAEGKMGHNLFTAGISKLWGKEVWNNLVVSDAFAAAHPQTVYRSVKVISEMDTKLVLDKGFFTTSPERLCGLAVATTLSCAPADIGFIERALSFDVWLTAAQQQSSTYNNEAKPGQCAMESIGQYPTNDGPCNMTTVAGSAYATWQASEFSYSLKAFPYLPSLRYYQSTMDPQYINAVGTPQDRFPEVSAANLSLLSGSYYALQTNPAHTFCGDLPQPIVLSGTGSTFRDHEGGGHFQNGVRCDWHIDAAGPVLLSDIHVLIERDADKVYIYEGLCSPADCASQPLLALLTGGKGTSPHTLHNPNPRPPILVPGGKVTVAFVPDATADVPLAVVVADGVSMKWEVVTAPPGSSACPLACQNGGTCVQGACQCAGGWAGADCSSQGCMGTRRLAAGAQPRTLVNGVTQIHNADCRWIITSDDPSMVVVAEIVSLDLDYGYDPLTFYDGDGLAGAVLGSYSGYATPKLNVSIGERCPGPLCAGYQVSSGATMTLRWTSDSMDAGQGFRVRYSTARLDDVRWGAGAMANCSGQGARGAAGCICGEGYYGRFCQYEQCSGATLVSPAMAGRVRNMAATESGYARSRDCSWRLAAPAKDGKEAGALAFYLESFDLESHETSTDALSLAAPSGAAAGVRLTGRDSVCVAANASVSCQPYLVLGKEADVRFVTDKNDYPPGASFTGFQLRYVAIYDCPRDENDRCVALTDCASLGMVAGTTRCVPCPANMHFDSHSGGCRLCNAGLVPSQDQQSCELCGDGKVVLDRLNGYCSGCSIGTFAPHRGMTACLDCGAGSYADQPDRVACSLASFGHFVNSTGAKVQVACQAGTFAAEAGLSACVACFPGTAQPSSGRSACDRCGRGKFAGKAASACKVCPGQMTSEETGTASLDQCGCPEGTYRDKAANSSICHPCPAGLYCPFGADEQAFGGSCSRPIPGKGCIAPETKQGFMTMRDDPLSVWVCATSERCPGGYGPGECAAGLTGRACHHCALGSAWNGNKCQECTEADKGGFIFPVLPILLIPCVVLIFYKLFGDTIERWGSWQNGSSSLVFICLNHFQIATILLGVNMELPLELGGNFKMLSTSSDVTGVFRPECTPYAQFQESITLKASAPLIVLGAFVLTWCCSQLVGKYSGLSRLAMEPNRTINAFLSIIFAFFGSIVEIAFALFKCGKNPNGESTLLSDRSLVCQSQEWNNMLAVGIAAVLFWCVGFGGLFARTIMYAPDWFYDKGVQMRWKFLFIKYRPDVHWWAMIIVLKGIFLQQGQLFLDRGVDQIFWLNTVLLCYALLVAIYRPWRHLLINLVDVCANLTMLMASSALIWFAGLRIPGDAMRVHMSRLSYGWCFVILPMAVLVLLTMIWIQRTAKGQALIQNTVRLIEDSCLLVRAVNDKELDDFLRHLGEVDLWFHREAALSILTEMGGRKVRFGLSSKRVRKDVDAVSNYKSEHSIKGDPTVVPVDAYPCHPAVVEKATYGTQEDFDADEYENTEAHNRPVPPPAQKAWTSEDLHSLTSLPWHA